MRRRTRERMQECADMWETRGIRVWEEVWWMMPSTVGDLIGKLIGAGQGQVVMHPNVSICQSIITSCLNFTASKRNKIVSESLTFPSNLYIYHSLEQAGARLRLVSSDAGIPLPPDRMLGPIDEQTLSLCGPPAL